MIFSARTPHGTAPLRARKKKNPPTPPRTHRARPALGRNTILFSARPLAPTGPAPPRAGTNTFFGPGPLRPVQKQKNLQGKLFFRQPQKRTKFSGGQENIFFPPAPARKNKLPSFFFSPSGRREKTNLSVNFVLVDCSLIPLANTTQVRPGKPNV